MKTVLYRAVLAVTALMLSLSATGQEAGILTLHGHVKDSRTEESLFFSSVNLAGTNISNVSNSEGFFSLKIPSDTPADTEVSVSHLGYLTRSVKVGAFSGHSQDNPLEIGMVSAAISLDPATVQAIDAGVLFRSAYYKVKENYPTSREGLTAFYREMVRKGTAKYLVLNEAVIDIDKAPYTGFSVDRAGIYKGRGSMNYDSTDTLFIKLQGGINTAMQVDMVKNPFAGVSLDEAQQVYAFTMGGVATYDNMSFYVVNFAPRERIDEEILFKGKVYIETESLAIGRVEFSLDVEGREEQASKLFILKRPSETKFYVNSADYVISYRNSGGKWHYDYFRADLSFSARKKRALFKNNFSVTEEMAVTDHKDGGIAISTADRVRFKDILSDQVSAFTDDNFWEDYNIIEPDQSIDVVIRRIVRQLNRRR